MARLLSLFLLTLVSISQICAQSTHTYVLEKPGILQKLMKGNEGVTNLSISGVFNEKDLKFITSLKNLKVLDIRKANLSPKARLKTLIEGNNKYTIILDTLKCSIRFNYLDFSNSSNQKLSDGKDCFYSYHRIIYPRYFVVGNDTQVNFYKESPKNDYAGINIFPNKPYTVEDKLKVSGTLYLKDAISVGEYFDSNDITRVVFSKKIRIIDKNAFWWCDNLNEVIFEDDTNVSIDEYAFPKEGHSPYGEIKLKRIRVPYGKIQEFVSMGFPKNILIDKTPDIKLEVEVQTPGSLAEQLGKVDLRLIQALTIKGILNSDDFDTINKMINLEQIDIKNAFVFVSIEEKKADAKIVASLLGMANEGQYQKDGKYQNYETRKKINERVEQGYDKTITCELPRNAFMGNPLLECLRLPATLTNINMAGIGGSNGYSLSKIKYLKEIWISKTSAEKIPMKRIVNESKVQIRFY